MLSLQGSTALYGGGLGSLRPLQRLQELDLAQCKHVDSAGLAFLSALRRLATLNVTKCPRIEGADFVHLAPLRNLPHLVVVGLDAASRAAAADLGFRVAAPLPGLH